VTAHNALVDYQHDHNVSWLRANFKGLVHPEGVSQDANLAAWEKRERYIPDRPYWPYYSRIVRNRALHVLRMRTGRSNQPFIEHRMPGTEVTPMKSSTQSQNVEILEQAIGMLKRKEERLVMRMILNCSGWKDRELTNEVNLAYALNMKVGTVKKMRQRSEKKLRKILEEKFNLDLDDFV